MPMLCADVSLTPVTEPDIPVLRELAKTIWRRHYAEIISATKIDFMLAADTWLELLRVGGKPVGYCEYARTDMPDGERGSTAVKLGQLCPADWAALFDWNSSPSSEASHYHSTGSEQRRGSRSPPVEPYNPRGP